ncbi:BLUF domain-containing protein [Psychroserpens sp. BH13MA-6]
MIYLKENSPIEMLRQMAVYLGADLKEDHGAAILLLDNKNGKGSISLYEVFPGLTAWVYRITFSSDFKFDFIFQDEQQYYFGYHHSGYQLQKFSNEEQPTILLKNQNFIIVGEPGMTSDFTIPKDITYECCYLIINPDDFLSYSSQLRKDLTSRLEEVFAFQVKQKTYRYLGDIDAKTDAYVSLIIDNERTDLIGRLAIEGSILNMLSSQLESYNEDMSSELLTIGLTKAELSKITEIGDFIRANLESHFTMDTLVKEFGMGPKKLQKGIKHLYGCTVNELTINIKMAHAKELIETTDMTISEICYSVGYSSRSYFSKVFQKRYHILPSDFKAAHYKNDSLFEVSYRSIAKPKLSDLDIKTILNHSVKENRKHQITGSLIYHNNVFFQLIEGPKRHVLQLYENIQKDNRHYDIVTMWQGPKAKREFKNWDMAMITDDAEITDAVSSEIKGLNLEYLMGDIKNQSLLSERLWRKVRNTLKLEKH